MSVNKCIIIGRIGKDIELRTTQSGKSVVNLAVATNEKYTDKAGEKHERTEWHNIVAFDQKANFISQYGSKGSLVYIEGKLTTRSWESDNGTQYRTEILADTLNLIDSPNSQNKKPTADTYQDRIDFINAEKQRLNANKGKLVVEPTKSNIGAMMEQAGLLNEDQIPF